MALAISKTQQNGNNEMTTEKNTSPLVELSTTVENLYSAYITSSEDLNSEGLNLISDLAQELKNGCTQEVMKATMKATAKGHNRPSVTASHVSSIPTASLIINAYVNADIYGVKPSKVLSVAVRVMGQVGASGVKAHLKQYETFAQLDKGIFDEEGNLLVEGTMSKADSQAANASEAILDEVAGKASAITLESIIDAVDVYLLQNDLKSMTTTDLTKLSLVISKLVQVAKNTKAVSVTA